MEQSRPKSPAKRVKCSALGWDSRLLHVSGNNCAGRTCIKGAGHSGMAQENICNRCVRTAIEDVIRYGISTFGFQGKGQWFTGFVLGETNLSCPPVNAAQFQSDNVTGPQTTLCSQNHHGIISFSNGCIPIRMCKQPIQFIFGKAFVEHFPGCYKFWKG